MNKRNRAFVIVEVLMASLIIVIVGSVATAGCVLQNKLLIQVSHRMDALSYAQAAAELLMNKKPVASPVPGVSDPISTGTHTETSDPEICGLPECYFKNVLKGSLSYVISDVNAGNDVIVSVAEITVRWQENEKSPSMKEEVLVAAVNK